MNGWAINTQYVNIPVLQRQEFLSIGTKGSFSIESDLETIDIKKNNHFLLIKPYQKELVFTNKGTITNLSNVETIKPGLDAIEAARKKNQPNPKDRFRHTYNYSIDKILIDNNNLDDLKYSLKSVDNFGKPQVHFQQQFRQLKENDFSTIVNGYIYTARTVFGKLVNSIPRQNKLEFMLLAMEKFNTIDFVKISLLDGIEFLNEYINRRILSRGRLLVATDNLITRNLKDQVDLNEIGFIDEETGNEKNLKAQADIFKKIFDVQKNSNFLELIQTTIQQNKEIETHFFKIFKTQTWPIDLRI
jgi:hypothetical protein